MRTLWKLYLNSQRNVKIGAFKIGFRDRNGMHSGMGSDGKYCGAAQASERVTWIILVYTWI